MFNIGCPLSITMADKQLQSKLHQPEPSNAMDLGSYAPSTLDSLCKDDTGSRCLSREDLARELEATVGEKRQLGQELTALALKFQAAQSLWERHLEQHDGLHGPFDEEVLDKVVDALTVHNRWDHASFSCRCDCSLYCFWALDHNGALATVRCLKETAHETWTHVSGTKTEPRQWGEQDSARGP